MLFCTFNMKLGGEDPPTWISLGWQTPHRAGALQQTKETWRLKLKMQVDWLYNLVLSWQFPVKISFMFVWSCFNWAALVHVRTHWDSQRRGNRRACHSPVPWSRRALLTGRQTSLSPSHTWTSQCSHTVDTFSSRWKRNELNLNMERLSLAFSKMVTVLSEEQLWIRVHY